MSNDVTESTESTEPTPSDPTADTAPAGDGLDPKDHPVEDAEHREGSADGADVTTDGDATTAAVDADAAAGAGEEELAGTDEEGSLDAVEDPSGRRRSGDRRAQLEREGEVAADFLETLLDICDLDGDLDVDIDGDRAAVAIVDSDEGRVPRRLVGSDGQVLEALQELTRLAVQSVTGERSRLMLDIAGHRAERRAGLVAVAKSAIEEVRSSGERRELTPMTAFERKVVHDEVLAAGLVSESEGSEPRRYVVILPE